MRKYQNKSSVALMNNNYLYTNRCVEIQLTARHQQATSALKLFDVEFQSKRSKTLHDLRLKQTKTLTRRDAADEKSTRRGEGATKDPADEDSEKTVVDRPRTRLPQAAALLSYRRPMPVLDRRLDTAVLLQHWKSRPRLAHHRK